MLGAVILRGPKDLFFDNQIFRGPVLSLSKGSASGLSDCSEVIEIQKDGDWIKVFPDTK